MKISTTFFAIASMALVVVGGASDNPGFPNATIVGAPSQSFDASAHYQFGAAVELSDDGFRMAVGADRGGQVFLYERTLASSSGAGDDDPEWTLIWQLSGNPGESIGDRFSLSGDGNDIAVRRYDDSLFGDVEVYRYDASTATAAMIGRPMAVCGDSSGKAVKLGKTPADSFFGETAWLLVSCESFDKNSGLVEILRYDDAINEWTPFSTILGGYPGSSFGWETALGVENPRFLQIAVASPNFDLRRGMVQLFSVNQNGAVSQWGRSGGDIVGEAEGDRFGFSMQMSAVAGRPVILVGAPQCAGGGEKRGCVTAYGWSTMPSSGWLPFFTTTGANDNDRFGRDVAISKDGNSLAASSIHHGRQTGMVRLFERDMSGNVVKKIDLTGEAPVTQFGNSISLCGETGMLLAVGIPRTKDMDGNSIGSVQVFDTAAVEAPTLLPLPPKGTDSPSDMPSDVPSNMPSLIPTFAPTGSPTKKPTGSPTMKPSLRPTSRPTSGPSASSAVPSSTLESAMPSGSPSTKPSGSPSTKPSGSPISSMAPSSSPPPQLGSGNGNEGRNANSSSSPQNHSLIAAIVATCVSLCAVMA